MIKYGKRWSDFTAIAGERGDYARAWRLAYTVEQHPDTGVTLAAAKA